MTIRPYRNIIQKALRPYQLFKYYFDVFVEESHASVNRWE